MITTNLMILTMATARQCQHFIERLDPGNAGTGKLSL